ncbi:MAG: protein phosphatase 2C domain-containing protein [Myxococcota bacterium]
MRQTSSPEWGLQPPLAAPAPAVLVEGNLALIAHVGDSRVYRLRRGRLECLTKDHSFANECRDELRPSVLPEHFASMITRCIAADSVTMPDLRIETTEPGDVFMICSDGITDVLGNEEMGDLIDDHEVALEAAEALVAAAYDAESYDNITCVIVHAAPRAANVSAA